MNHLDIQHSKQNAFNDTGMYCCSALMYDSNFPAHNQALYPTHESTGQGWSFGFDPQRERFPIRGSSVKIGARFFPDLKIVMKMF